MHCKLLALFLLSTLSMVAAAPDGSVEGLKVRDLLDSEAETPTSSNDDNDFDIAKKKNPCKRRCNTDRDCCHTDDCFYGVCLGPQKPPRA